MQARRAVFPLLGLTAGGVLGNLAFAQFHWHIPAEYAPYLSVAALAALDTVFGGIRAGMEGRFENDIFASGFVLNTLLAALLAWAGDHMGINLALVAVLVLGQRIFNNLSLMRRFYLNKLALKRKKQQEEQAQINAQTTGSLAQKTEMGSGI